MKLNGAEPPKIDSPTAPFCKPQVSSSAVELTVGNVVSFVTKNVAVATHVPEAVTETVYAPGARPLKSSVAAAFDHA